MGFSIYKKEINNKVFYYGQYNGKIYTNGYNSIERLIKAHNELYKVLNGYEEEIC